MGNYPFLILCAMIWVLALFVFVIAKDIRKDLITIALLSLPFAFTEVLFYPHYWNPPFLFDLPSAIGFGIEDFLFVSGLGIIALGIPAVILNISLKSRKKDLRRGICSSRFRLGLIISMLLCLVSSAISTIGFPAIFAGIALMGLCYCVILFVRKDLAYVSVASLLIGTISYGSICAMLEIVVPGVFEKYWHTKELLDIVIWRIPLEELLYGGFSFALAVSLYPLLFDLAWENKEKS